MTAKFKRGVTFNGVQPECVMGIMVATHVMESLGHTCTVTSIMDGKHLSNSLHYAGLAFDLRTWANDSGEQLPDEKKQLIARSLRQYLGADWDVVVESTHIHCEFDPKG